MPMTLHSNLSPAWPEDSRLCPGDQLLASIASVARSVRIPAGRRIFNTGDPGDGCYFLVDGAVKVTLPTGGQETLLAILGKGEVFGEMALLDRLPRSATVTALRPCELYHLSAELFDRLAAADAKLAGQLLRVVAGRLRAGNAAHAVHLMPLRVRLARAFLNLARTFGEPLPDRRMLIRQKVSQADLGNMIGAARENINRQLTEWRRERLLSRISGYYCLEQPKSFEDIARGV
jgi:CRP/FNR family transcriptional regulator, cyclic AMP receptor protein